MKRLQRKLKKAALTIAAQPLRRKGFSEFGARLWLREKARDLIQSPVSRNRRIAHKAGFALDVYQGLKGLNVAVSQRDYLSLQPMQKTQGWNTNRMVARRFLPGLSEHCSEGICTVFGARGSLNVVRLNSFPKDLSPNEAGLIEVFKRFEAVQVLPVRWDRGVGRVIQWNAEQEHFAIDGWPAAESAVINTVVSMTAKERCVFSVYEDAETDFDPRRGFESALIRLYIAKNSLGEVSITEATVLAGDSWRPNFPSKEEIEYAHTALGIRRGWKGRRSKLAFREERFENALTLDLTTGKGVSVEPQEALELPETMIPKLHEMVAKLESMFSAEKVKFSFISVDVNICEDGTFRVRDLSTFPRYSRQRAFAAATEEHLSGLLQIKLEDNLKRARQTSVLARVLRRSRQLRRRVQVFQLRSQGFTARMAKTWVRRVERDRRRNNNTGSQLQEQAYQWGFLPQLVKRFGVTEANRPNFISERDYRFVQPLNGKYGKWVRDRVSALAVFEPFNQMFEATHYQIVRRDTALQVIPLSSTAQEYGSDIESIGRFIAEQGPLVLASSAWSGRIFLNVSYEYENFVVDGVTYSNDEFEKLLAYRVREQFYVLVQPTTDQIAFAGVSETSKAELQISMMNPSGSDPQVAEAFVVVHDEVLMRDFADLMEDDGTADSEQEADAARSEHREDVGPEEKTKDLDDARVENDSNELDDESVRQKFFARINIERGTYSGVKTVVSGLVQSMSAHPTTGLPFEGSVPGWEALIRNLEEMCHFAPQLAFVEFRIILGVEGPKIRGISATPTYSTIFPFSPNTTKFLQEAIQEKSAKSSAVSVRLSTWFTNAKRTVRKRFAKAVYPDGLVPYQSVRWLGDIRRDLFERNGLSLRTKVWAYRNGFLSYRIPQYGITPENRQDFISDFEYRWLRHINKKYKYWLEDKISIKYVAAKHNECLPAYYFYTSLHGGKNHVIPMMDCPEGYGATFEDILRLARDRGVLALKPDEGSHGEGFFRLAFEDGQFTLNGEPASEERVLGILQSTSNQYLVTEFIVMHPVIAEIYPNSVNTIRVIVFKKDGITPEIGNAYMRIGSLKSGYVDNTAAGGMLAKIDVPSGWFGDAQALERGRVTPCPVHPDTGVLIEGVVPNWEFAKRKVLEMAADLPQLEYLGFDLAITEGGIKLPEINRSPDYPRIDLLTRETTDYLLHKLHRKKMIYGYDLRRPRRIMSLPRRDV